MRFRAGSPGEDRTAQGGQQDVEKGWGGSSRQNGRGFAFPDSAGDQHPAAVREVHLAHRVRFLCLFDESAPLPRKSGFFVPVQAFRLLGGTVSLSSARAAQLRPGAGLASRSSNANWQARSYRHHPGDLHGFSALSGGASVQVLRSLPWPVSRVNGLQAACQKSRWLLLLETLGTSGIFKTKTS